MISTNLKLLFFMGFIVFLKTIKGADCNTVVVAVAPPMPPIAVASLSNGEVVVEVVIDPNGNVKDTSVLSGHPLLRQMKVFEQTARLWKFDRKVGTREIRRGKIVFSVRIMSKGTPKEQLTPIFYPPNKVEIRQEEYPMNINSDPKSEVKSK